MARDYGRITTGFWSHAKIRPCSDQAKLLANYLMTGPHSNSIGAYLLPNAYAAEDLGWELEIVLQAFRELFRIGFVERFEDGRHLVICDFLDWNPIENPNVGKAAIKQLDQLPDDPALRHIISGLEQYKKHFPNGFGTVRKRVRNIEPSRAEPEPEPEREPVTPPPKTSFEEFWKKYPTQAIMSKPKAETEWRALPEDEQSAAVAAIPSFRAFCAKDKTYPVPHAATFLREKRFLGFAGSAIDPAKAAASKDLADRIRQRGIYAPKDAAE